MSNTTNTGESTPIRRFEVSLEHHLDRFKYILRHKDINAFAIPGRLRLIDIEHSMVTLKYPKPALTFVEMYRGGEGAVGEYSKYGFAQRLSEKGVSYSSVVSQFGLVPPVGDPEVNTSSLPPYPGCDDGAEVELSKFGVEVHENVMEFFLDRYKNRPDQPQEIYYWSPSDNTPPNSALRYIWIDRLCIMQEDDEDRKWHDIEFQKDIHAAASQCFALPYGLLATICTTTLTIPPAEEDEEQPRGPFIICRRQRTSIQGDPLLLNLLSAKSGLSNDPDGTIISCIRETMDEMTGTEARPPRSLWKDQMAWRALFSRLYDSHSEFIDRCWETLLKETTRNAPGYDESGHVKLTLAGLANQLSNALSHGVWLGGVVGEADPACALLPTIPLRDALSISRPNGPNHPAVSPFPQGRSPSMGDDGRTMFVVDGDFRMELSEEGPRIMHLKNTPARRFMRSTKSEACEGPALQFECVSDSHYYWVPPVNTVTSGSGKSMQVAEEVWLVYLGSVNVLGHEKVSWVKEPDYKGYNVNKAQPSSPQPRRGITSSLQAAAKHMPSPSAQTYRFAILTRHHTAESPRMSPPDLKAGPRSAVPGSFTLEKWVEKEVTTRWLIPTAWDKRTFQVVLEPQDAPGPPPPYLEQTHVSDRANDGTPSNSDGPHQ